MTEEQHSDVKIRSIREFKNKYLPRLFSEQSKTAYPDSRARGRVVASEVMEKIELQPTSSKSTET